MKWKKGLGYFLLSLGMACLLLAGLATALPLLANQNEQIRLILSSLESHSRSPLANTLNGAFLWMLQSNLLLLGIGVGLVFLSIAGLAFGKKRASTAKKSHSDPFAPPPNPNWRRATRRELPPLEEAVLSQPPIPPIQASIPLIATGDSPPPRSFQESPKQEATNPFRSYGQSAYAPPRAQAKPEAAPAASSQAQPAYQRPAEPKPPAQQPAQPPPKKAAGAPPFPSIAPPAYDQWYDTASTEEPPTALQYMAEDSSSPYDDGSYGDEPYHNAPYESEADFFENAPSMPQRDPSLPKVHYLSGRIRSTVHKRHSSP